MKNFFIIKWLRNVSIAKKLYFTVGIMALFIATELMTLLFAIHTLSSVRTLVGAEGLWSKAQKDAVYNLEKYGVSRDEKDYATYLSFLKVPLGDRRTRLALNKVNPDLDEARKGFLDGRLHPDDIDGAIKLITRFHGVSYIAKATAVWATGDTLIYQLQLIGDQLHAEIISPSSSPEKVKQILGRIDPLNKKLTIVEDDFSYILGEGSRWLTDLILKLLLGLVLTIEISGLSLTIFVSRGISRGLNEIISSANKIAKGDYSIRAKEYSKDEIGILANAFNEMTAKLEQNIDAIKRSEAELSKAKDLAEESNIVKDHFLANMSHEIRTPMNAIIGFTNFLEGSKLDEEQKDYVRAIKVSGQSLVTIINDILDYSKIEAKKIVLESIPFNVRKLLNSVRFVLRPKTLEKDLEFIFDIDRKIPEILIGDPTRLTQVLTNLIDNAIKFTEKGGVMVYAFLSTEDKGSVTIEFRVKDTGKGIPENKQSLIFERFTQESAETTRKHGGTGLGLSIAKSLVELQGGTMSLKSELGLGSAFSFFITYSKPQEEELGVFATQKLSHADKPLRPLRILYAEDNQMNQKLIELFSKKFGFDTDIAENGKIAIEKMMDKKYDLVLMDMQMPEMDGYEATRIIRQEMRDPTPIIALTAHAMSGEREKCLELGMDDFVAKPFDPKFLNERIHALFRA